MIDSYQLPKISDGVMIHGLYTDAFRFDVTSMKMVSEEDRIMHEKMPLVHMEPVMDFTPPEEDYQCPVYKTAARAGVLSTTGKNACEKVSQNYNTEVLQFFFSRRHALSGIW